MTPWRMTMQTVIDTVVAQKKMSGKKMRRKRMSE
jgi:hypothetical protein